MQSTLDLNCDLGEGAPCDAELMPLISSANIACGAHAGSLETMIETVELALRHNVAVGAHPGYFDLENFGRRERDIAPGEAARLVLLQLEQLHEVAGAKLRHVKLHGALYTQVSCDRYLAEAVISDLVRLWPDVTLYALANSELSRAAQDRGMRVVEEAFADRTYRRDGSLTPRTQPNAVITDPEQAVAQVLRLVREGRVQTVDGGVIEVRAGTLCLHSDTPDAVTFARLLRSELERAGVTIRAPRLRRDLRFEI